MAGLCVEIFSHFIVDHVCQPDWGNTICTAGKAPRPGFLGFIQVGITSLVDELLDDRILATHARSAGIPIGEALRHCFRLSF